MNAKTTWYNAERVRQPGSVILKEWNQIRAAQKGQNQSGQRMYEGAKMSRMNSEWNPLNTSADSEIITSLRALRARSRQLFRDNEYAISAQRLIVNSVIGSGVGMQAQVKTAGGKLLKSMNDRIEEVFEDWTDSDTCDPAGTLALPDMERLAFASLIENGEVLIRRVRQPFGAGSIPYALELIEADRLVDQWSMVRAENGNAIRMGVEQDQWRRPVAYWLYPNHPGDYQFSSFVASKLIRVPAEDMFHLYIPTRIGQTRGVPWLHATLKRLHNMAGYEEAEIVAARAAAAIVGIVQTQEPVVPDNIDEVGAGAPPSISLEPGTIQQLRPGETFQGFNPSRPNAALDPFMRFMLRGFSVGVGVSYHSVSGDYSTGTYSSLRLAMLNERDIWRALQGWWVRNFRLRVHRDWMQAAVLAGELSIPDYYTNQRKYWRVRFKPRGWSWIDPTKEVAAYKDAVRCGFMLQGDVIAQTSEHTDFEDVVTGRRAELDMIADNDLVFDTDPGQTAGKGDMQQGPQSNPVDDPDNPDNKDNPE